MRISFRLYSRKLATGRNKLQFQFSNGRGNQITKDTNITLYKEYWDKKAERVTVGHPDSEDINRALQKLKAKRDTALTKFENGTINFDGVIRHLLSKGNASEIINYIDTRIKDSRFDVTYQDYKDKFKGLLKLTGSKANLKFTDLTSEFFALAHKQGERLWRDKKISPRTYREYISNILTISNDAYENKEIHEKVVCPKTYKKLKGNKVHFNSVEGSKVEDVYKAIIECQSILELESIGYWLLCFCLRGFYPADVVLMTEKDMKELGSLHKGTDRLLSHLSNDEMYVLHHRSKTDIPMFVQVHRDTTYLLIKWLKMMAVHHYNDKRLNGKRILADINDLLGIYNYNHKDNSKFHKNHWKYHNKRVRRFNLGMINARKTFNQIAEKLEFSEKLTKLLIGHMTDKLKAESYDLILGREQQLKIQDAHKKVLDYFKVPELIDAFQVKLRTFILQNNFPEWLLIQSGVHKVGREYKVLVGTTEINKPKWAKIDPEYKWYFKADKSSEIGFWKDEDTWFENKNIGKSKSGKAYVQTLNKKLQEAQSMIDNLKNAERNYKDNVRQLYPDSA
mgnify:FL=1